MLKSTLWVSDTEGRDKEALVFVNPGKPENVWYNNHLLRFYLQTPPKANCCSEVSQDKLPAGFAEAGRSEHSVISEVLTSLTICNDQRQP